ncbi:MAG TPA: NUDIX hydrolase [Thermoanaerobaculia bacterium]|nr:NUDIX hydrolase [Thermoanaerobaculia bacterium]
MDKSTRCSNCGQVPRRDVAADVVIIEDGSVLLVKRGFPPDVGRWAAPGGYVEWDESVEDAARREVAEETGLIVDRLQLVAVHGAPSRHPEQLITVVFLGEAHGELNPGDDAVDASWFPLDALPGDMALDHRTSVAEAAMLIR